MSHDLTALYSGTTFEREGLQAMLTEVEKGNIGTIIVIDMSRLGRNYVQMGMLREQLRRANVRLIAVNEGVDTGSGFDDDFLPFRDVINEYYATADCRLLQHHQADSN